MAVLFNFLKNFSAARINQTWTAKKIKTAKSLANCILQSCAATCAKNSHAIQDTWNRKNNNLRKYQQNYVRAGPFANTRVRAYLVGNSAAEILLNLVSHATVKAIHPRIRLRCMIRAAECWSLMTINAKKNYLLLPLKVKRKLCRNVRP